MRINEGMREYPMLGAFSFLQKASCSNDLVTGTVADTAAIGLAVH